MSQKLQTQNSIEDLISLPNESTKFLLTTLLRECVEDSAQFVIEKRLEPNPENPDEQPNLTLAQGQIFDQIFNNGISHAIDFIDSHTVIDPEEEVEVDEEEIKKLAKLNHNIEILETILKDTAKDIEKERAELSQKIQAFALGLSKDLIKHGITDPENSQGRKSLVVAKNPKTGEEDPVNFDKYYETLLKSEDNYQSFGLDLRKLMSSEIAQKYNKLGYSIMKAKRELNEIENLASENTILPTEIEIEMLGTVTELLEN